MYKKLLITMLCSVAVSCGNEEGIATVDGQIITQKEYEAYLQVKRIPLNDNAKVERFLDQYIERQALTAAIENEGVLDQGGIEAEIKDYKNQITINRYFERYLKDKASDEAIQNFYAQNPEKFTSEKVKVAHILLRVDKDMGESERQALLTRAHEIYSKLRAGDSFEELAKVESEDKVSAAKGGSLGWIQPGAVSAEFSQKAFAMKKGEVSEPFLTVFGFHILTVLEEKQTVKQPLEAVKGDIRYQLRNKAKEAEIQRLLGQVKYSRVGAK